MPSKPAAGEPRLGQVLKHLERLHPKKIDLSLGRIERLLKALGDPQNNLPPVIHVAGTNGKGSVVAILRAILEAAGLKVHAYTSPHLVSFRERIRIAGALIGEDDLIEVLNECERANGDAPVTFFEITTAAALLAFSRTRADVCLLEVGLGGRLDATNVIEHPLVTVITPVGLDHAEFLGTDLAGVATEKAGIAKQGAPLVVGAQKPEALAAIEKAATAQKAPVLLAGRDWNFEKAPAPALAGAHQVANAALAVAALSAQDRFDITADAVRAGLQNVSWPARFQSLDPASFPVSFPAGTEIRLDGGHNPLAAAALAEILAQQHDPARPVTVIAGVMKGKDVEGFLKPLAPFTGRLLAVPLKDKDACVPPEALCETANKLGLNAEPCGSLSAALEEISGDAESSRVLITGSLYLAGEVLRITGYRPA